MLKVVSTKKVRLGMFIQELKGAWIDHPFWKKAFKLEDPSDLKKLQASVIKEVVIDITKGFDVAEPDASADSSPPEAVKILPETKPGSSASAKPIRITASEEHERAKQVITGSKKAVASMFHDARMGKAINAESAMQLVDDIAASVDRNLSALISLVRLKNKDEYTYMHSVAVCALMVALAKELGLSEAETKQAGLAGLLHDIGKAGIPLEVLNKPGALTDEEFILVKLHPERGHELLLQANIVDEVVLDVCLHHHEKVNGKGYPHQLKADAISIFAKMGAVCDVYDAITSNRPYKEGWEPGISLQRMAQWSDHFDDRVFKAFVKSVGIYPIGSMIKLKSGRLAVVIDQSPKSLLTPLIKVFFSTKSNSRIKVELVDLSKIHEQDSIVGHENPLAWGIHDINEIWSPA
ncbi:MAG: HD-GYP domain-containing protein [Methylotenera sp.]|uniref:HD-GYP domain-containing protein n=1 Tax=Methylotenera sp. TaxID=2051956 RepID=UPI002724D545|nr:HD-GYP domain-containing protein [Methylotenera sp.]MDO9393628.1 HD-GYP domain-containing protein [Methylotenera sp.]MDP1523898.1 HD-GYP domain-containing protein [Methylotenera sp.]MDP3306750.1 HD-GYP domain-containing protein [Methylotenera sp.]